MPPLFPDFIEREAQPDDPLRLQWQAARPAIEAFTPEALIEIGAAAIADMNVAVNRRVAYRTDGAGADFWQAPSTTWDSKAGDCEDFAILKYAILRRSGMAEDDLRLCIGEIIGLRGNRQHAWLGACLYDRWYALDNLFSHLEPLPYLNWRPLAAMSADKVVRYDKPFVIAQAKWPEA